MSIDSIKNRISEIEARIAELTPSLPTPANTAFSANSFLETKCGNQMLQPFNLALAQAKGAVQFRPTTSTLKFSPEIEVLVDKYSAANGVDPDVVKAIIQAESGGDPNAVSSKDAKGLMQLMPAEIQSYGIRDPFNPDQNIAGGTRILAEKLKQFHGDLRLALAAYNAGTGAVKKYNGVPPYPETEKYVNKIYGMLGRNP